MSQLCCRPWNPNVPSQRLCDVKVEDLRVWAIRRCNAWIPNASGILRIWDIPSEVLVPILDKVLKHFPRGAHCRETTLNSFDPGMTHGMHVDNQGWDWLTRVHVPLVTNPGVWHQFEGFDRMHFEVGAAYSFDTQLRHAFGNDGPTPRIHLVADVHRAS